MTTHRSVRRGHPRRLRPLRPRVLARPRERIREGAFKALRDTPGLVHFAEREFPDLPFPVGPGYWALTRHDDIWHVSRNPQLFCSGKGANIGDQPQEMNEFFGSMINMDDPRHFRLRSIVSKGFTPKEITAVEDTVRTKANEVIDRLLADFPDKTCDFVENVAAALPLEIICDMMGIPPRTTPGSSSGPTRSSAPATPSSRPASRT